MVMSADFLATVILSPSGSWTVCVEGKLHQYSPTYSQAYGHVPVWVASILTLGACQATLLVTVYCTTLYTTL